MRNLSHLYNSIKKVVAEYESLTKEKILNYEEFNHFSMVHHSTAIEGSKLSEEETHLILKEGVSPANKSVLDIFMVVDHFKALKYTLKLAENKEELTIEKIKKLSSLILRNTGQIINVPLGVVDSTKGDFRLMSVRAGKRTFMDYSKVPERTQKLIQEINKNINRSNDLIDIYKLAFDSHFQMVSIHPFADGNGRLARLMMSYIQCFHGKPLSIINQQDKLKYYDSLEGTRKQEDLNIFREFMFKQTEKQMKKEIGFLKKKQKRKKVQGRSFLF